MTIGYKIRHKTIVWERSCLYSIIFRQRRLFLRLAFVSFWINVCLNALDAWKRFLACSFSVSLFSSSFQIKTTLCVFEVRSIPVIIRSWVFTDRHLMKLSIRRHADSLWTIRRLEIVRLDVLGVDWRRYHGPRLKLSLVWIIWCCIKSSLLVN